MHNLFLKKLFLSHYTHLTPLNTCRAEDACIPMRTLKIPGGSPQGEAQNARPGLGAVSRRRTRKGVSHLVSVTRGGKRAER